MSNMKVATVILMDQDAHLKGKGLNIIGKFEDVVINASEDEKMTLLKLAMGGAIEEMLSNHNKKRCEVVNSTTLERTGRKVMLQEITIEDVTVIIK